MENLIVGLPFIPIFFTLYGMITKHYMFFMLGFTIFTFFIIVLEYLFYIVDNDFAHILAFILFLLQLIVSYPTSLRFDGTHVFKSNTLKVLILLAFINLIGIFVVLNNPLINNIGVAYHSFFIIASFIFYYFISANKLSIYERKYDKKF